MDDSIQKKKRSDDFRWFVDNYDLLYQQYGHKFLVVKNKSIIGSYDSMTDALDNTHEERGTFLVQECTGDPSAYTFQLPISYYILKR